MQPPTIAPRWGTWFLKWIDAKDPWEAFDIWHDEMYQDYEWFFDYCEGDDHSFVEEIDWYYEWYRVHLFYYGYFWLAFRWSDILFYWRHYSRRLKKFFKGLSASK